jgi:hypothetical protein
MSSGYRLLMGEFRTGDFEDAWGTTMEWWFAVAENLYHNGVDLPAEWEYRDSPMHVNGGYEPEGYAENFIVEALSDGVIDDDDLMRMGNVLFRYAGILKAAGKDY